MGILDELRDETERKKVIEQSHTLSTESLTHNYQQEILPKMQMIFDFFKELVEHLLFLKNPIIINNYSHKYPDLGELYQLDYKFSSDKFGGVSHYDKLMEITIKYYFCGEEPLFFDVKNQTEIDSQVNFLTAKKVPFTWERQHNISAKQSYATFAIEKRIPVKIIFKVNYTQSTINLEIFNHSDFDHTHRTYLPNEINTDTLDQLAKYLLRKDNSFIEEKITESERETLRENLRKNINFGDNKYESQSINAELKKKKKQGLIRKIESFLGGN